MSPRWALALWLVLLPFAFWNPCAKAEPQQEDDTIVVTKEISGKVSAVAPGFLNIVYQRNKEKGVDYEMPLHIAEGVQLRNLQRLSGLKMGDTVSVTFTEKQRKVEGSDPNGRRSLETHVVSREATTITFLRPARSGLVSGE